jgi:hypothetical protein
VCSRPCEVLQRVCGNLRANSRRAFALCSSPQVGDNWLKRASAVCKFAMHKACVTFKEASEFFGAVRTCRLIGLRQRTYTSHQLSPGAETGISLPFSRQTTTCGRCNQGWLGAGVQPNFALRCSLSLATINNSSADIKGKIYHPF